MKQLKYILILLLFSGKLLSQHSSLTSNYLFNLFAVNPAYAGQKKALDVTILYRKQWAGFSGAPQNISLLSSLEIKPKNFSLGFQYDNDKIGLTSTNVIKLALAYRIKINRDNTISLGVMPAYKRLFYDFSKLNVTNDGDATFVASAPVINTFNTGAGIFYTHKKGYFGVSTPQLVNMNGYYEFNAVGGLILKVSKDLTLKPSFLVRQLKNSPVQFDLNLTAYINDIVSVGLAYRNKDAIVGYFDILFDKRFKLGYAYDLSIGALRKYNSGSHEIMLNYFFGKHSHAPSPRYF